MIIAFLKGMVEKKANSNFLEDKITVETARVSSLVHPGQSDDI
jgi:hypothetical protein